MFCYSGRVIVHNILWFLELKSISGVGEGALREL